MLKVFCVKWHKIYRKSSFPLQNDKFIGRKLNQKREKKNKIQSNRNKKHVQQKQIELT